MGTLGKGYVAICTFSVSMKLFQNLKLINVNTNQLGKKVSVILQYTNATLARMTLLNCVGQTSLERGLWLWER